MPDDTNDILQQIVNAGLYGPRSKLLQQNYDLGQQWMQPKFAQGREVGRTYVAASPIEHLSNAIRQIVGGKMAGDAQRGERDLTNQLGQSRRAYMGALQTAQDGGSGGTLGQEGGGMARPPDPQAAQQLMMAGAGSGDPAMEATGHFGMQGMQLDRQNRLLENTLRHQEELERQGRDRLEQGDERVKQRDMQLEVMRRGMELRGWKWNPNTSEFVNLGARGPGGHGGAAATPPNAGPGADGSSAPPLDFSPRPLGKWQSNDLQHMVKDFDPNNAHGEYGKQASRVSAANRVLAVALDDNGNPKDLTVKQMPEVASAVASLIGGSAAAQAQIEHLLPSSYSRDAAGIKEYLTNNPQMAGQQGFVAQFVDTAKREQATAQKAIESVRGQMGGKYQRLIHANPFEVRQALNKFNWDLGPDGMPVQKQQAPPPAAAGATDALRKKYGL